MGCNVHGGDNEPYDVIMPTGTPSLALGHFNAKHSDDVNVDIVMGSEPLVAAFTSGEYDILLSQRGFFDSFVHGAVQGYSYHEIASMNQIDDLPKCTVMVHLCADSTVAYNRIKDDDDMDKFETPAYMRRQEFETRRGFRALTQEEHVDLSAFDGIKNFFIDTTELTSDEVFCLARSRLKEFSKENLHELASIFDSQ